MSCVCACEYEQGCMVCECVHVSMTKDAWRVCACMEYEQGRMACVCVRVSMSKTQKT